MDVFVTLVSSSHQLSLIFAEEENRRQVLVLFLFLSSNPESDRVEELLVVDYLSESSIIGNQFRVIYEAISNLEILIIKSLKSVVNADKLL